LLAAATDLCPLPDSAIRSPIATIAHPVWLRKLGPRRLCGLAGSGFDVVAIASAWR